MPIKGTSKNVIEISETGNEFFERAILFLRPDSPRGDGEELREKAREFLTGLRLRRGLVRRPWRLLPALRRMSAAGAAIIAAAALVFK